MEQDETHKPRFDSSKVNTIRRKIETQDAPQRDVQVLYYLYHRAGMSIPEMADRLDVSGPAIWQQMSRHCIERRSVSEAMILHHLRE